MDANVAIQIQNNHKEEFSTRILDDSKDRFASQKKATMFPPITAHIISNIISLHVKNLDRVVEIGIPFMHIFEANWPEGFLDLFTKLIVTFT